MIRTRNIHKKTKVEKKKKSILIQSWKNNLLVRAFQKSILSFLRKSKHVRALIFKYIISLKNIHSGISFEKSTQPELDHPNCVVHHLKSTDPQQQQNSG